MRPFGNAVILGQDLDAAIRAILECLGLPSYASPITPPVLAGLLPADPWLCSVA